MRIVFMGTPDFGAASLKALIDANFNIVGVYTQPDRPRHRMKVSHSAVKQTALDAGLEIFQPEKLRTYEELERFLSLKPDLLVVVAYGKILPDEYIFAPTFGAINVHASLLPKYRGSAPIQWSVLNGDEFGGVTTMYVMSEVDSGDIIYQQRTRIGEHETSGQLFGRLRDIGAELLVKTVHDIEGGIAPRIPQNSDEVTLTTILSKGMSPIDWNRPPREIVKHIHGLDPWPVATATLCGEQFRIFGIEYTNRKTALLPGKIISADRHGIEVACGDGTSLLITELQTSGGKRMSAASYLLGHPMRVDN